MIKVYSKALKQSIHVSRVIGTLTGDATGPVVIFTAGIHGNEPAGVFALNNVFSVPEKISSSLKGKVYGISGNLGALQKGRRYQSEDLNRIWTSKYTGLLEHNKLEPLNEDVKEQIELYETIKVILSETRGPYYFIDLHTTSGNTIPFAILNDTILNRKFTMQYPLPLILGIEEYLQGAFLSYINEFGYVAFGYESGQHNSIKAIACHESFIYVTLFFMGVHNDKVLFENHYKILAEASRGMDRFYEIVYEYKLKKNSEFKMKPGFENFQHVRKNEILACEQGNEIKSPRKGQIFMPLYQQLGDDGFFLIRNIPYYLLALSGMLRKIKLDNLLPLLPGVNWQSAQKDTLVINSKIARFMAKQFFHLLGYRSYHTDKKHLIIKKRDTASKNAAYKNETWY